MSIHFSMLRGTVTLSRIFTDKTLALVKKYSPAMDLVALLEIEAKIASTNKIVNQELHLL